MFGIPVYKIVLCTGRLHGRQRKMVDNTNDLILNHNAGRCLRIAAVLVKNHADTVGHLPHIVIVRAIGVGHTLKEPCICYGIRIAQHKHILRGGVCVFL